MKAAKSKGVTALSKDLFDVIDTLELASNARQPRKHAPLAIAEGMGMVQGAPSRFSESTGSSH